MHIDCRNNNNNNRELNQEEERCDDDQPDAEKSKKFGETYGVGRS